jgi:hypothetical protein
MRKLLILSLLTVVAAAASGCNCWRGCGPGWRPGALLFGAGQPAYAAPVECCDPCAAPVAAADECCE